MEDTQCLILLQQINILLLEFVQHYLIIENELNVKNERIFGEKKNLQVSEQDLGGTWSQNNKTTIFKLVNHRYEELVCVKSTSL